MPDILNNVNKSVQDFRLSRLFAVVMIGGSQFKVTTEDVIIIRNQFYPTIGDRIRLEKVRENKSEEYSNVNV